MCLGGRICLPLSFITMGLAVAFMWFLYPMHIDYSEVLRSGTFFYEANMLGPLPVGYDIPWRGDSFINDTNILGGDLDGGWITGGAAGADLPRAISPAHRVPTSSLPDCIENHPASCPSALGTFATSPVGAAFRIWPDATSAHAAPAALGTRAVGRLMLVIQASPR